MAVLTDGQEWQFFLPAEQGQFSDRRVYKLDLLERNMDDIVQVLNNYLEYSNVISGKAIELARKDYRNIRQQREAANTLPEAWNRLIEEGDELLIELVIDKVESLCGYKPSPDQVVEFLTKKTTTSALISKENPQKKGKEKQLINQPIIKEKNIIVGFTFLGQFHACRNARDVLYEILNVFIESDPTFLQRFEALPKHGRTRRYVAKNRRDLNPSRPDLSLSDEYSKEIRPGWFVNINLSKRTIEKVIRLACQVANIQFGHDLSVNL